MPATNKKVFFRYGWYFIFTINIATIILLLAGYVSWYVSPAKTTMFAYIGLAFPIVLSVNLFFFFFWLVFRKWKFLLVSGIALLCCIKPIITYFPLSIGKPSPEGSIKLLTYNVRGFNWFDEKEGEENDVIGYIRTSNADIVCIQEFMSFEKRKQNTLSDIKKKLEHYPYYAVINLRPNQKNYLYGLACFSKYPIISATEISYKSDNGSVIFKIDINGKTVNVINNHLESNRLTSSDKEMYRRFFKESGTVTLDDLAHNIRGKLGNAYAKRAPQADTIASLIKSMEDERVVVCGDFNDTPISYTYHKVKGDLKDAYIENNFGPDITYHENKFWFMLDFILYSKGIQSYGCTIDKVKYSDHYPIWAYLKIE